MWRGEGEEKKLKYPPRTDLEKFMGLVCPRSIPFSLYGNLLR
jgi:hypothetical protein